MPFCRWELFFSLAATAFLELEFMLKSVDFMRYAPICSAPNWCPHQHSGQFNEIYPDLPITVGSTTPRIRHDSSASFSTNDAVRRLAV